MNRRTERASDQASVVHEFRGVAEDVHHGWKHREARSAADTLAHIHARAAEAGVPADQLAEITDGFAAIARDFIAEQSPKRRRRLWTRRSGDERTRLELRGPRRRIPLETANRPSSPDSVSRTPGSLLPPPGG